MLGGERMKVQEYNRGHSLRFSGVFGVSFGRLCRYISQIPGVSITRRRRFLWWTNGVGAEFTLGGHLFKIETDPWDGQLWILAQDGGKHQPEFQMMREHFQKLGVTVECHAQPSDGANAALGAPRSSS